MGKPFAKTRTNQPVESDLIVREDGGLTIGGLTALENVYIQGEVVDENNDSALDIGTSDVSISKNVNIGDVGETKDLFVSGTIKSIDKIVDSDGNPRFVEGSGTLLATIPEGVEITYNKWSLSGSHLMIVLAGNVEDETVIPNNAAWADYELPSYIMNKILPVWGSAYIENKSMQLRASDWTTQSLSTALAKYISTKLTLIIVGVSSTTLTANRSFRIQYDLLIDTE